MALPDVYCHSRDYPLLQPLLMALFERALDCGRALFPLAFLLTASVIGLALRRRTSALAALLATVGWLVGYALQLSLQHDLHTFGASAAWPPTLATAIAMAALLLASDRWLGTCSSGRRRRRWIAILGLPTMLIAGPLLMLMLTDNPGTFATYLSDPGRALSRITRIPSILIGAANHAIARGAFGLTWLLPPVLWWLARRRPACATSQLIGGICLLFGAIWLLPFLLSPIPDLTHHLRSTLPRLLDHGTGVAWLLTALLWHRLSSNAGDDTSPRPVAS
jgi:hypothetical protein